jgi:glycine cleavage system aminomethyltransferase T
LGEATLPDSRSAGERNSIERVAGEGILRNGKPVGEITSAGYSARLGRAVVMGYVRGDGPITREFMLGGRYVVDIAGDRVSATPLAKPPSPG